MEHEVQVAAMLTNILSEFEPHVYEHCSYERKTDIPVPTLANEVLSMLSDRWVPGLRQRMGEMYPRLKPALQLASLFLTMDYPLCWFSHLTFGERRLNAQGQVFVIHTPYSLSSDALSKVEANLQELGKVIILLFEPSGYEDGAWGRTYHDRNSIKFLHEFRDLDFPSSLSHQGKARRVCIVMNRCFTKFYQKIYPQEASLTEKCRAWIMFTNTLVHEITHAYYYWLHGPALEPLWDMVEKRAELGFSWEANIFGHVMDPIRYIGDPDFRFRFLFSIQANEYATVAVREQLIAGLKGRHNAIFTEMDVNGKVRKWPKVRIPEFRGARWSLSEGATAVIAAIHTIPLPWIANWFQQDKWLHWNIAWGYRKKYMPPLLEDAFMVLYVQNDDGVQILLPLNPTFSQDANILRKYTLGEADTKGIKR
jgi:hypothetical protein